MTLRKRVVDIAQSMNIRMAPSTLQRYYAETNITYKSVDLHSVNKLKKVE